MISIGNQTKHESTIKGLQKKVYVHPRDDREIANCVSYNAYRSSINVATRLNMT